MRCDRTALAPALITLGVLWPAALLAAEAKLPDTSASPQSLVQAALESELNGPSELRKTYLDQALASDPNYAPARWQSGFIRWDGEWLTPEEVAKRAAHDPLLAEYRRRRDAMVDKADDHRTMAAWCHKNKLADEERIHWVKVLEFEPNDAEALAALGLQWHQGRLLTRPQIEQAKKAAAEQQLATKRWQPQFVKWRGAIDHGTAKQREAAIADLAKIADPSALPALEAVFGVDGETKKALELNQLLVEAAGRIPGPEATALLLRRSLAPDSLKMRAAAADQLSKRPMHAYVPQLIAALPGQLSTRFHVTLLPNGTVVHEHLVLMEGRSENLSMTLQSAVNGDMSTAAAAHKAVAIESGAQAIQARLDRLRGRIQFVLERSTGMASGNDPEFWQKQYDDDNGWYTPSNYRPTYFQSAADYRGYVAAPTNYVATNATPIPSHASIGPVSTSPFVPGFHTCFAAGTPILTTYGPRPIETIQVGDRVLAQDPETGRLDYKPVQTKTLRPSTALLRITLGTDSILATPGHPFWVNGDGWRTAKRLKVGDHLHSLDGAALIEQIEEARPSEVYNLVVSELHNYFVGSSRLLAHDNSLLMERAARVPGLAANSALSTPD
jgi:hypothetical protein